MSAQENTWLFKWSNFGDAFVAGFTSLYNDESMLDVTIVVGEEVLHAHKCVLSVCSAYFRRVFQIQPSQQHVLLLHDVNVKHFKSILDYMYRGEAVVDHGDIVAFWNLARSLKINGIYVQNTVDKVLSDASDPTLLKSSCHETSRTGVKQSNRSVEEEIKEAIRGEAIDEERQRKCKLGVPPDRVLPPVDTVERGSTHMDLQVPPHPVFPLHPVHLVGTPQIDTMPHRVNDVDQAAVNIRMVESNGANRRDVKENIEVIRVDPEVLLEEEEETKVDEQVWPGGSRRKTKPLSAIWSFFYFNYSENKSECRLCGKIFKASPKTGTASIKYHLGTAHQIHQNDGHH